MTRKLPFLFVVIAAVTAVNAVSLLQAQDCKCPASKSNVNISKAECDFCQASFATASSTDQQEETCTKCLASAKATCTSCKAGNMTADTIGVLTVPSVCSAGLCSPNGLQGLQMPGSTSFIQEQSSITSDQRKQMADELSAYLTNGQHDPEHIRQVLEMALNSAADSAHRHAMLTSSPSMPPVLLKQTIDDHMQYYAKGQKFNLAKEASQPAPPVIEPVVESSMDLRRLQHEQESMQNVIMLIQQDLQRIARDLSQLHVESRMNVHQPMNTNQPRPFAASRDQFTRSNSDQNTRWQSIRNPHSPKPVTQEQSKIEMLSRQVALLQQQLRQSRMQDGDVRRAAYQESVRLLPRTSAAIPLTPTTSRKTTVTYYVGDLMQPPFASATLKLMQFIKSNVATESWADSRMMQITQPSISLVITQTRENHDQIGELLRQIRIGARTYQTEGNQR